MLFRSRLRPFQNLNWGQLSVWKERELFEIALDHLNPVDLNRLHRCLPDFILLWGASKASSQELVYSTVRRYISMLKGNGSIVFGEDSVSNVLGERKIYRCQPGIEVCCARASLLVRTNDLK